MNCKKCGFQIQENFYFCPNCGEKIKEPPFKFSVTQSIKIILLSLLVPPFGVVPSFKYIKASDSKAKIVGILGLFLNILVLVLATIYLYNAITKSVEQVNQLTNPQGSVEQQIQSLQGVPQ